MAAPESLFKYVTADLAKIILSDGTLRWSSPELFNEPWAVKYDPKLNFDHLTITKAMLNAAVSMIFTRDMPPGNLGHPLYKAIRRWRADDRFNDETEAFDALKELLAPTPESLQQKLSVLLTAWKSLISNSRVLCLSETYRDVQSWKYYADNHRGLVMKFKVDSSQNFHDPKPVVYSNQRCQLTTVKEQVDALVGIKRASGIDALPAKILTKSKLDASEKEWRCIRTLEEQELDCGEDVEDWYLDEPFQPSALQAVYFGFMMSGTNRKAIAKLIKGNYPSVVFYAAIPLENQFELEFEKFSC